MTSDPRQDIVLAGLRRATDVLAVAARDPAFVAAILAVTDEIVRALRSGGKLLIAGNGGSAAHAQHIAAELLSRFLLDRAPLPAIALTTDSSALTAIGNDYSFEQVFERQIRGLGRKGDVFLALSTSGGSPNILSALKAAREMGIVSVGFSKAAATPMHALCDLMLGVPSEETALIQQVHITAAHAICGLVERDLFGELSRSRAP